MCSRTSLTFESSSFTLSYPPWYHRRRGFNPTRIRLKLVEVNPSQDYHARFNLTRIRLELWTNRAGQIVFCEVPR